MIHVWRVPAFDPFEQYAEFDRGWAGPWEELKSAGYGVNLC
jgi:hypothetical protein